jgi:hypothetical protein
MKQKLLLLTLILGISTVQAQLKVDKISYRNTDHFITTTIGYPVAGLFLFEEKSEPSILLNADGTGVFQFEDLSKKNISWGIACSEEGIPVFNEGFNSATYTFWYKTDDNSDWIFTQFSIHYNKKKMFIMGERVKSYAEDENPKKSAKIRS